MIQRFRVSRGKREGNSITSSVRREHSRPCRQPSSPLLSSLSITDQPRAEGEVRFISLDGRYSAREMPESKVIMLPNDARVRLQLRREPFSASRGLRSCAVSKYPGLAPGRIVAERQRPEDGTKDREREKPSDHVIVIIVRDRNRAAPDRSSGKGVGMGGDDLNAFCPRPCARPLGALSSPLGTDGWMNGWMNGRRR